MALNTSALNTVYNHYLASYAPKGTTPYDTHKKSELRSIYNSIIKLNKESPLYLLDTSKKTQEFAVGIKENARDLRNTIASLGGVSEDELLNKKSVYSTNEEIASGNFVGDSTESADMKSFQIEVSQLATPQVNTGNYIPSNQMDLKPDTYSFDIGINNSNYEFQFNINAGDTNKDVQDRLSRLITNTAIGLDAETLEDGQGNSSLCLRSTATGIPEGKQSIFTISDSHTSKTSGTIDYFGVGTPTRYPTNSSFKIDGNEQSTSSNTFTVEKTYELTLNGISSVEGETATIGLKPDTESLTENIGQLIQGYNSFVKSAAVHLESQPKASNLLSEMGRISTYFKPNLTSIGLQVMEDGTINLDKDKLVESASSEDAMEQFAPMKDFTNSLLRKTNQISLNPMNYVDKTIVAYKNPGKNFASPYVTSAYSGMMFNSYC